MAALQDDSKSQAVCGGIISTKSAHVAIFPAIRNTAVHRWEASCCVVLVCDVNSGRDIPRVLVRIRSDWNGISLHIASLEL